MRKARGTKRATGRKRAHRKERTRAAKPGRTVEQVMTRRPVTVHADEPLEAARRILLASPFRHLPVLDRTGLVGVLSDRDLLAAVTMHGVDDAMSRSVREVMKRGLQLIRPDATVSEAASAMVAREIGCLPVVEEGRLTGIVTAKDVLAEIPGAVMPEPETEAPTEPTANDLMTPEPVTAVPEEMLFDAVARMAEGGVRHLPVIDPDGRLVGMLSDRDVRAAVGDPGEALRHGSDWGQEGMTVRDVMRNDPVRVEIDARASDIAGLLADEKIGAVPVVDESDRPIGIVSYVDLLAAKP